MVKRTTENVNKEELIMKAAEEEFLEKGFNGTTMRSISTRANVDHPLVHYYFNNKEQLFEKVIQGKIILLVESVARIFEDDSLPLKERLTRGISAHVDFISANPLLPKFLVTEMNHVTPVLMQDGKDRIQNVMTQLAKVLPEGITPQQLIMDAISLDIFPFLIRNLTSSIGITPQDDKEFAEKVKQENIATLIKRLGL